MAQTREGALKTAAKMAGMSVDDFEARLATEKRCTKCKEWRTRDSFGRDRSRSDGLNAKCRSCCRVAVRMDIRGRPSAFKGKTHTDETRAKIRATRKANPRPGPNKGKPRTPETRAKISASHRASGKTMRGAAHHAYRDGRSVERRGERLSAEYKRWRYDVFTRDSFACRRCSDDRGGNLNAHHIHSFAKHPELRMSLDNGITLCVPCHKAEHAKAGVDASQ